jgi:hypothetical protein
MIILRHKADDRPNYADVEMQLHSLTELTILFQMEEYVSLFHLASKQLTRIQSWSAANLER